MKDRTEGQGPLSGLRLLAFDRWKTSVVRQVLPLDTAFVKWPGGRADNPPFCFGAGRVKRKCMRRISTVRQRRALGRIFIWRWFPPDKSTIRRRGFLAGRKTPPIRSLSTAVCP